jgi:hypothetical protein
MVDMRRVCVPLPPFLAVGLKVQQLVTATTFMVLTNVNKFLVIFFGFFALGDQLSCASPPNRHPRPEPRPRAPNVRLRRSSPPRLCYLRWHVPARPDPEADRSPDLPPCLFARPRSAMSVFGVCCALGGGVWYGFARSRATPPVQVAKKEAEAPLLREEAGDAEDGRQGGKGSPLHGPARGRAGGGHV